MESEQYLRELVDFLSNLNDADKQDAVAYYSEYIADAGLVSRQQIVDKLGTPKHLAFRIMADYSVKEDRLNNNKMKTVRSNSKMIGLIILAVLSAPMTLGIGAVILLGLLCMIISIVVFVIGLFGGLIIGGVTSFYFGLTNILKNFYTGIFYFGTGFVISGLLLILWPIIYWMSKEILQVVANLVSYLYQKFRNRQRKDTKL
ncbi:DUF1700 domain-containing protein [Liquorilactobacillus cacaonum]|uniref:Integral membrane protein n=1 Tax=Liquorilactobacillus cacaonum DSM 21116 TaxID=1423729 RepID=A0A0R2CFJ5_9LACO|nr:DUF1700 domain-containing protein [Liquorilactobacillus cacaonum]KRM90279.1 hypothetical protein FC80_GL001180 [Liquorilactobacillus cacaonum DSM 21116]